MEKTELNDWRKDGRHCPPYKSYINGTYAIQIVVDADLRPLLAYSSGVLEACKT